MRWLRSKWLLRCVALLLVGAMLPALLAPSSAIASSSLATSYAGWIKAQLLVPDDPAVHRALDEAVGTKARTFDAFVEAFLEAYDAGHPPVSAARIFTDRDLTNDALIVYLQRRYTEIAAEALPPRVRFVTPSTATAPSSGGFAAVQAVERGHVPPAITPGSTAQADGLVASLRPITPARPQGP